MPGLVPGIHVFRRQTRKTWMAGTSPAMTRRGNVARMSEAISGTGLRSFPDVASLIRATYSRYFFCAYSSGTDESTITSIMLVPS
jgi:hypothetical protein